jgi:hypothetical protein
MDDAAFIASWIEEAALSTQELVNRRFEREQAPEPGSAVDQCGLRNGLEIIRDFLKHEEHGLALDHLLYMLEELDIALPSQVYELVVRAGRQMCYPESTWAAIKRETSD